MNLRGIANNAIQGINPNISVVVRLPNGYTVDPNSPCYECGARTWCPDAFEKDNCDDSVVDFKRTG